MSTTPLASVVIRTYKGSQQLLPRVLDALATQSVQRFEIVAVDSGSTEEATHALEDMRSICPVTIVPLSGFTYPRACNAGAAAASGSTLVFLSDHSIPVSDTWLADGLRHLRDPMVAGVYGSTRPIPGHSSRWERAYFGLFSNKLTFRASRALRRPAVVTKPRLGVMNNNNALLRTRLWRARPFDERFARGGEDLDWATYWLGRGYRVMFEPGFSVLHSHNLGFLDFFGQVRRWHAMARGYGAFVPQRHRFDRLS